MGAGNRTTQTIREAARSLFRRRCVRKTSPGSGAETLTPLLYGRGKRLSILFHNTKQKMSFILWFWSTETEIMERFEQEIGEIFKRTVSHDDSEFVTDAELANFEREFIDLKGRINKEYDEKHKDKWNRPERYWKINWHPCYIAKDSWCIFLHVCFWFVNTKHPFSPDWFAGWDVEKTYALQKY